MKPKETMPAEFKRFWYGSTKKIPTEKIDSLRINENVSKEWRQFLLALHDAAERNWK